jgi:hypothetical protein
MNKNKATANKEATNGKESVKLPQLGNKTKKEEPKKTKNQKIEKSVPIVTQATNLKETETKSAALTISIKTISIKQIVDEIIKDESGIIKASGKPAFIIDPAGLSRTFLRYSANYFNCSDPELMNHEKTRAYIIGAIRYGKVLAFDLEDREETLLKLFIESCESIQKDLFKNLMSRQILNDEMYLSLVKKNVDGADYDRLQFNRVEDCKFVFIGSSESLSNEFLSSFTVYKIE